jgi:hypothetical protein
MIGTASFLAVGMLLAPPAAAVETFDPCFESSGKGGARYLYYPATDPISGFDFGQLRDLNGDGWVCAWTPPGKFDPPGLSPWVVIDNPHPVARTTPA